MAGKDKAADDFKIINEELKRIQREEAEGAKKAASSTSSPPPPPPANAADDFATIRAAAEKLKRERTKALNRPDDPSVAWKPPASHGGVGASVEISGHEKTFTPLANIVAEYRKASFDSSRNYNFSQQRQDEAIKQIMVLSQFYSRSDAVQMLGRAVASAQQPRTTWKPPRGAPKSP